MTNLKKIRVQRGLKAIELARKLNITRQCVSIAEKNGIRNAYAAQRYAAVLCCRPEELMDFNQSAFESTQNNKETRR